MRKDHRFKLSNLYKWVYVLIKLKSKKKIYFIIKTIQIVLTTILSISIYTNRQHGLNYLITYQLNHFALTHLKRCQQVSKIAECSLILYIKTVKSFSKSTSQSIKFKTPKKLSNFLTIWCD